MDSGSISLPSTGFFSPFPRGTSSLSVVNEYLALSSGLDGFTQSFTCNALLGIPSLSFPFDPGGYHALWPEFPIGRIKLEDKLYGPATPEEQVPLVWAVPCSLATTYGISVDFFSSSYLDVSVRSVRFLWPMYSARDDPYGPGFPIRTSADQSFIASSPQLFAGLHVLHRL